MGNTERLVWYQGTTDVDGVATFAMIQDWWAGLSHKRIIWQQRLMGMATDPASLDWTAQRFDEQFTIVNSEIRGITLYWSKADDHSKVQNTTPQRLEFDLEKQQLYIFPVSQNDLVLRVTLPQKTLKTIRVMEPEFSVTVENGQGVLTFKSEADLLKVEVVLSSESLLAFKQKLP